MPQIKPPQRVLTFFAHPDDETLAAGATMSKLSRAGVEIHVAIPSTGVLSRYKKADQGQKEGALKKLRGDCLKAMDKLGVNAQRVIFGDFPDNEMDTRSRLELIKWLEDVCESVKPDVIFTHHRYCTNIDHQYCHEAAVIATRPNNGRQITLISAEVPSSTGYLKPVQWEPNYFVEVNEEDIRNKVAAMHCYEEEARLDPHPRSPEVLTALAKVRGSEAGFNFAESFMIQRVFG